MEKPFIPEGWCLEVIRRVTHCPWCGYHDDDGHAARCPFRVRDGGVTAESEGPVSEMPGGLTDEDLDWINEASGSVLVGVPMVEVRVRDLTTEIRRLRSANRLLHLSRGSSPDGPEPD